MKPTRRWFQYSLRSFLVVLTALAVWLGVVVRRATEQREAVKAIEALGGVVIYDWQLLAADHELRRSGSRIVRLNWSHHSGTSGGPASMWHIIGDDLFHNVVAVIYTYEESHDQDFRKATQYFQQLPGLKTMVVGDAITAATLDELMAAFPECDVEWY